MSNAHSRLVSKKTGNVKLLAASASQCSLSSSLSRKAAIIIVGIADMDHRNIAHTEYPVNTIIIHEEFDNHSMSNNIALLRTDSAMHFDDLVQSICFLDRQLHQPPDLQNCWVSGWNPTSAVNAILLLEEAVCVLAVG